LKDDPKLGNLATNESKLFPSTLAADSIESIFSRGVIYLKLIVARKSVGISEFNFGEGAGAIFAGNTGP